MGKFDNVNAEGIETYPNELNKLSDFDDVDGNGVFDPNDSHGNIHPEDGIFQDHESIPGYIARDKFYTPSEVRDLTQPDGVTMYVPGGAVSFQQGQMETYQKNQLLWELPPSLSPVADQGTAIDSTVNAPTATWPVGAAESPPPGNTRYYVMAAGAGLLVGAAVLFWRK